MSRHDGPINSCGKVRYRDEAAALDAIERIRTSGDVRGKTPQRAYRCPSCGRWHLTSRA